MATNRDNFILKKIDDLDPATSVNEDDVLIFEQAGVAKKATVSQFRSESTLATSSSAGTVKTNTNDVDPIVYLKSEVDALFPPPVSKGGTGSTTASGARTNLGFGTIATQDSNSVSITGGSVTGISDLAVADGGTGASSASAARNNLGAAASGSNSDITSLNGLTTALSIGQGGTGATSASTARTALGVDPTTAQYNASQIQSKSVSSTAPTTGQTIVFNGTSYVPRMAGKIVQVIYGFTTTPVTTSTTTYVTSGLTASITPLSTTSKILVLINIGGVQKLSADGCNIKLVRGATDIIVFAQSLGFNSSTTTNAVSSTSNTILDSPASTSALTYTVQFANLTANGSVRIQNDNALSAITLMEIAA